VSVLPQDETGKAEHAYDYDFEAQRVAVYVDDGAGGIEIWDGTADFGGDVEVDTDALEALVAAGNVILAAIRTSVEIMDDWDESDRAKVNPIVGQAGIAAGAGAVGVTVPRVTLASDDPLLALQEDHQIEYKLADFDAASDPIYVGKTDKAENWIITEYNIANGTARYISGAGSYAANWTGRAGLSYDPYYTEF